ncbi:MAG: DUF4332 domain-containing protein [bacterium]|nr:DUF4332 domain-containing protein [bacterium]
METKRRHTGARLFSSRWAILGLALLAAGLWTLIRDLEGWNAAWYVPAWYGYLLLLDAVIHRLGGHGFLSQRRRELGAMMFWSVPFWMLFEAYNLVIENWYYVFVVHDELISAIFTALSFATVLPACFFHAELIRTLGWCRRLRWRPIPVGRGMRTLWLVMGVLSVALPLIWPRYAFPLVWGATLWLPDLVNYKVGAPSFLRDLERGRGGRLVRLLLGGLGAGVVWELFNYWARCKWIYTVPGFEEWKLFEMPILGFLGFPVLAVAAVSFYAMVCHFLRGGRSWEAPDREPAASPSRRVLAAAGAIAIVFSLTVFLVVREQPTHSRRPLLAELRGIDTTAAGRLREAGIPTPERLSAAVEAQGVIGLAERVDLDPEELERAHRHAALALHKGMGTQMASLLAAAGITGVADLGEVDSGVLFQRLRALAERAGRPPPRLAQVRVWVRAARWSGTTRR